MENANISSSNQPKKTLTIDIDDIKAMTRTVFHRKGTAFTIAQAGNKPVEFEKLPPATFTVEFSPFMGYYLDMMEPFPEIKKVYGSAGRNADRILNTFNSRKSNLGVSLQGLQGSGKTMLARLISIKARQQGMPTLVINSEFKDEAFFKFLYSIQQECVILFDEFEKVYTAEGQVSLLTVLDGTFPSKKLFILTSNDRSKLNTHLLNRPGRIHYFMEFKGLPSDFVQEYVKDTLTKPHHEKELLSVCGLFENLNFDSLAALVWEVNQYDERPSEVISILNARPTSSESLYTIRVQIPGIEYVFTGDELTNSRSRLNPTAFAGLTCIPLIPANLQKAAEKLGITPEQAQALNQKDIGALEDLYKSEEYREAESRTTRIELAEGVVSGYSRVQYEGTSGFSMLVSILDDVRSNDGRFRFRPTDLKSVNMEKGEFTFINEKGTVFIAKREVVQEYSTSHIASLL